MDKEWIKEVDGHNLRFKRETLLPRSVGSPSVSRWGCLSAISALKPSDLVSDGPNDLRVVDGSAVPLSNDRDGEHTAAELPGESGVTPGVDRVPSLQGSSGFADCGQLEE